MVSGVLLETLIILALASLLVSPPSPNINTDRSWELFKDFYFALLESQEPSLAKRWKYAHKLKRKIFIMDATTISLCLSLFDWAKFRTRKGGIKLHTVFDYDTSLPVFCNTARR